MRQRFKVRKERGWLNASYEAVRAGVKNSHLRNIVLLFHHDLSHYPFGFSLIKIVLLPLVPRGRRRLCLSHSSK